MREPLPLRVLFLSQCMLVQLECWKETGQPSKEVGALSWEGLELSPVSILSLLYEQPDNVVGTRDQEAKSLNILPLPCPLQIYQHSFSLDLFSLLQWQRCNPTCLKSVIPPGLCVPSPHLFPLHCLLLNCI